MANDQAKRVATEMPKAIFWASPYGLCEIPSRSQDAAAAERAVAIQYSSMDQLPPPRAQPEHTGVGSMIRDALDRLPPASSVRIDVVQHPDRAVSFGPDASAEHPEPGVVTVTDEMIAAGRRGEGKPPDWSSFDDTLAAIYRAMHAVAPVELISNGERIWHTRALIAEGRIAESEGERDEARREFEKMRAARLHECETLRTQMRTELKGMEDERRCWTGEIAALRAEVAAAHDLLAQRPAPAVSAPPTPPILNAIRPRVVDQRRIGG